MSLSSKTVKELRKIAREEGIRTSGRKAALVDRLERHMKGKNVTKGKKKPGSNYRGRGKVKEGARYRVSSQPLSWAQMSRNRADPFKNPHDNLMTQHMPFFDGAPSFFGINPHFAGHTEATSPMYPLAQLFAAMSLR
jgi:hypothetical protein